MTLTSKDEYVDYQEVLEDFRDGLQALRNHIHEHAFFEGYEDVVSDMDLTITNLDTILLDHTDSTAWEDLWDVIKDKMQEWWC